MVFCPKRKQIIFKISLSRQSICCRIDDISAEIETSQDKIKQFKAYYIGIGRNADITRHISTCDIFIPQYE